MQEDDDDDDDDDDFITIYESSRLVSLENWRKRFATPKLIFGKETWATPKIVASSLLTNAPLTIASFSECFRNQETEY
jgi:hypothetical protein